MIHETAIIEKGAEIGKGVEIGPYCVIGPNVTIGDGCKLFNNVTMMGHVEVGQNNTFYPFTVIGGAPQDISYKNEPVWVKIGNGNLFREYVTVNAGSSKDARETVIGNNNMLMGYCHVAHDCILEDNIIMANGVQLGGHVKVEKDVNFGGLAAVHHFTTIGEKSFVGGLSRIIHDVPPYLIVEGHPSKIKSINVVGLKRNGVPDANIKMLKEAYKLLYRSGEPKARSISNFERKGFPCEEVKRLVMFLKEWFKSNQGRIREMKRKVKV